MYNIGKLNYKGQNMYDLILRTRRLNKIKVALAFFIVVLIVLIVFTSIRLVQMYKVSKSVYAYDLWINEVNAEISAREEAEKARFLPLNEQELENFSNIYKHQDNKRVFLTFDDGPSTSVTPYILDLLAEQNIKATFFVLGSKVEANPNLVKREYDEGHYIANHGYSHKYSEMYSSTQNVLDEYNKTNDLIKNAIGNENYNSLVFRFPGGSSGGPYNDLKQEAKELLKQNGIASVDWNALTNDAAGANTKEKIMENFYNTVQNKTSIVILMHDASDKILTYECLPDIIQYFKDNGYEFKTMYDVIGRN